MRHKIYGAKLGRSKNEKNALFRGLIRSLFLHRSIITTESKAKAIKGLVDRLIVKAKKGDEASLNVLGKILPQQEIRNILIQEIAPTFKNRTSGFTSIVRLGQRKGDGAMMVKMSLVENTDHQSLKIKTAVRSTKTVKRKKSDGNK